MIGQPETPVQIKCTNKYSLRVHFSFFIFYIRYDCRKFGMVVGSSVWLSEVRYGCRKFGMVVGSSVWLSEVRYDCRKFGMVVGVRYDCRKFAGRCRGGARVRMCAWVCPCGRTKLFFKHLLSNLLILETSPATHH